MAQPTNDVVQMTGADISSKKKFDLKAFFLRMLQPGKKNGALPETDGPAQDDLAGEVVPGMNNDASAQNQHITHQDDTSRAKTCLGRDLWTEAWESRALSMNDKIELAKPWKKLDSQNESLRGFQAGENTKRRNKSAEVGQKGTNKSSKPEYVRQVINGTKLALEQRPWGTPEAPSTAGKVIDSVLIFKELGDAVIKFDASGYASSAWTVVSLGLTLVDNDKKRMDEAFAATAYLAELLTRYGKIESYYHLKNLNESQRQPLENAIVNVYTAILKYSAAVKNAAEGSAFDRIVGALTGGELESLKQTINDNDLIVKRWEDIVHQEFTSLFQECTGKRLEDIGNQVVEIVGVLGNVQEGVAAMKEGVDSLVEDKVLEWLCSSTLATGTKRHEVLAMDIERSKHASPGDVFLRKPEYKDWRDNPGRKALWLYAPFGCGKSWLCYSIIQDLGKTCAPTNPQRILLYWYFDEDTKEMTTVYKSFMRQLAEGVAGKFPKGIQAWLNQVQSRVNWREQLEEWFKVLKRHIFVVLDGLDEWSQGQPRRFNRQQEVLQLISTLIGSENAYLHVLLLSKNDNIVRNCFEPRPEAVKEMDIQNDLRQELDQFITRTMNEDVFFKILKPSLQESIKESLEKSEERNFLWATSLLDELHGCNGEDIKEKLQKVPRDMAKKYQQDLSRVIDADKPSMKRILMWLLRHERSEEPLTAIEVAAAAKLNSSKLEGLLDVVRALVTISPSVRSLKSARQEVDRGEDTDGNGDDSGDDGYGDFIPRNVEFVHFSARDYLEELWADCEAAALAAESGVTTWHWAQGLSFSNEEAHHEITKRCLQVLLKENGSGDGDSKASPLKSYAARYWHQHYLKITGHPGPSTATDAACNQHEQRASTREHVSELDDLIKQLLEPDSAAFKSWLDLYNPDEDHTLPHCELGCEGEDHHRSDSVSDSDNDGDNDSVSYMLRKRRADPIYYAVKLRLIDLTIQIIKDQPGQTYTRAGSEGTVLQLALCHQHWQVADTLLKTCNDSQTAIAVRGGPHGSPLYIASAFGKDDIVEDLIDKGARADGTEDGKYGSALHAAAYNGRTTTVQLLLRIAGGSVNQGGGVFGTALQAAAARGHVDTVQLLLDSNADPTKMCGLFGTALQAALVCQSESATNTSHALREAISKHDFESVNRSNIGWQSAFLQLQDSSPSLLHQYTSLFLSTGERQQIRNESGLPKQQVLLSVLKNWVLPGANALSRCLELAIAFQYQAPAQEHLEDIRGALPHFQDHLAEHELNKVDFFYKALFWSGINYILEHLEPLMRPMMASLNKAVRVAGILPTRGDKSLDEIEIDQLELRWRHVREFWLRFGMYRRSEHRDRNRDRQVWWDVLGTPPYDRPRYVSFRKVDMDLSDKIICEMARQKQTFRKQRTEAPSLLSTSTTTSRRSEDDGGLDVGEVDADDREDDSDDSEDRSNDDNNSEPGNSNIELHQVVDELLLLVKEIVEFGKQCDQLHSTVASIKDRETIKRLSFEVFAAVVRLAVSMKEWEKDGNSTIARSSLAQTVHLLRTVRVVRMTRLVAAVTLNELPNLVRKEMAPILDSLRDQMCEQLRESVRDAVRAELERERNAAEVTSLPTPETQPPRKWQGIF